MLATVPMGIVDEVLDNVQHRLVDGFTGLFSGWFAWIHDPIIFWYVCGAGALLAAFTIGWFLPFKWVRATLGGLLVIGGAFLAGGTEYRRELAEKQRELDARKKAAKPAPKPAPPRNDSWF